MLILSLALYHYATSIILNVFLFSDLLFCCFLFMFDCLRTCPKVTSYKILSEISSKCQTVWNLVSELKICQDLDSVKQNQLHSLNWGQTVYNLSHLNLHMRKQRADQLRSNCWANLKSEISCFWPASVSVQTGLCRTWSETTLLVLS